jgi:hypothetical protein
MEKAMDYAAFVALWTPHGRAQNLYVRETLKRTIVATHLTEGPKDTVDSIIDVDLTSPYSFHSLTTPLESMWPQETNYEGFVHRVLQKMKRQDLSEGEYLRCKSLWFKKCAADYVLHNQELNGLALRQTKKDVQWWITAKRWNLLQRWRYKIFRRHWIPKLEHDWSLCGNLISAFLSPIQYSLQDGGPVPNRLVQRNKKQSRYPDAISKLQQRAQNEKGHRARVHWTQQEEIKLVTYVQEYGKSWQKIASTWNRQNLPIRSNVDLKDKWRNLLLKYEDEESVFISFCPTD